MTPYKLNILVGLPTYGGNGQVAQMSPAVAKWLIPTVAKMNRDERIGEIWYSEACDTPIPMVRNAWVEQAKKMGADLLLTIDSDNFPDYELTVNKDPTAKPFWDTTFDFMYKHYPKGPCMVGAPYCGPSPHQNIYVFHWTNLRNDNANSGPRLDQYRREHAAIMSGIQECAALPTGVILFDVRCFDLVKPPYFYYQYEGDKGRCDHCGEIMPGPQAKKTSTEDVTATRDISLAGQAKLGYNPVFCNWDAWAGHIKQEIVGKPRPIFVDNVTAKFADAFKHGLKSSDRMVDVRSDEFVNLPVSGSSVDDEPEYNRLEDDKNATSVDRLVQTELIRRVKREGFLTLVAEIGTFKGYTAKHFIRSAPNVHVVCVDPWFIAEDDLAGIAYAFMDDVYEAFKENCKQEIERKQIEPVRGLSVKVAGVVSKSNYAGQFDLVYIDASHECESVKADIEAWLPHVREGGIICGHDFDSYTTGGELMYPGVRQAVEEIFGDDFERPRPGSSIWAKVVKKPVLPVSEAPVETNGHAKKRKRKLAATR